MSLVVLAYSGGLDTSAIVPWLGETYGARVLCYAADVGQGEADLRGLEAKALQSGAVGCIVQDLREPFLEEFAFPMLKSGAVYAREYLLGTAIARPAIASGQVGVARREGATALAHGCTGKGNDQIRFELTYQALAPDLDVIAPWRTWSFRGREDLLEYLREKGISVAVSPEKPYSRDRNLWHCSHEGGVLEDVTGEPPPDVYQMTTDPLDAPGRPDEITIEFDRGTPVALDSVPQSAVPLVEQLNEVAGAHGVGRADVVEDRVVGMKSRGIYETPGATVLRLAHRALEQIVLDRRTIDLKDQMAVRYGDLTYEGRWWSTERRALDAMVEVTQQQVSGSVRVRLYKGVASVLTRTSPYAVYSPAHATFGADDVYDQTDAGGFIALFGLPTKLGAEVAAREHRPSSIGS